MKQDIKYNGYTANPSDHESADGDLTLSLNLLNEDGALKPLAQPKDICSFPTGCRVIHTHATPTYSNYIVLDDTTNKLYWINEADAHGTVVMEYSADKNYSAGEIVLNPESASLSLTFLQFTRNKAADEELVLVGDNQNAEILTGVDYPILNPVHSFGPEVRVLRITSIGNTLCVLCTDGLHYILWRPDDAGYTYLGQKPPMVELSFGLSEEKKAAYDNAGLESPNPEATYSAAWARVGLITPALLYALNVNHTVLMIRDEFVDGVNDVIYALINKTNALITKEGHFYAPFIVRYCYRLYDESTWMHSAPVFMPVAVPNSYQIEIPAAFTADGTEINETFHPYIVDEDFGSVNLQYAYIRYRPHNVALEFKCIGGSLSELKDKWGDIVKSIDIFVSSPIIREDVNEKIKTASIAELSYNLTHGLINGSDVPGVFLDKKYTVVSDGAHYADADNEKHNIIFEIPQLSEESYLDKIKSVSTFYKIASYNIKNDTIPEASYEEVKIDSSKLPFLTTQEEMRDYDYKSHNIIYPLVSNDDIVTRLYNNNKRLYVTAPQERMFGGYHAGALVPYCQTCNVPLMSPAIKVFSVTKTVTYLRTEEGERTVIWEDDTGIELSSVVLEQCPMFYPDNRAYKMEIYATTVPTDNLYYKLEFDMDTCSMINGATTKGGIFAVASDMTSTRTDGENPFPEVEENPFISYPYKIYSSGVDNPFVFPSTGINGVGGGTINAIATVNEPVSTGQFGYSDIYIFTTEGTWVAKIEKDGGLSNINPISRDVCINPDSIVQLSNTVIFATERGIMNVSGSVVQCVSDAIATEHPFNILSSLPHASDLHAMLHPDADTCLPTKPFLAFLAGVNMLYDYIHQRIIVYNPTMTDGTPDYTYAYVFSITSKLWGMMFSNLAYSLNSYPEALAVSQGNHLVSFSATDETQPKGLLVTRPVKLGSGDTLKVIHTLVQRGMFERGHVKVVLYASRDKMHWHLIGSSVNEWLRGMRGSGYKWYRIAVLAELDEDESVSGVTVEYETTDDNRVH